MCFDALFCNGRWRGSFLLPPNASLNALNMVPEHPTFYWLIIGKSAYCISYPTISIYLDIYPLLLRMITMLMLLVNLLLAVEKKHEEGNNQFFGGCSSQKHFLLSPLFAKKNVVFIIVIRERKKKCLSVQQVIMLEIKL